MCHNTDTADKDKIWKTCLRSKLSSFWLQTQRQVKHIDPPQYLQHGRQKEKSICTAVVSEAAIVSCPSLIKYVCG